MNKGLEVALDGLPANLTLEKFVVHPKVQKKWRASLGYSDKVSALFLAATIIRTPLTSHPTYQAWTQADGKSPVRTVPDRLLTTSLDAMIKMQSVAYPVFNAFRNGLEVVLRAVD